MKIDDNATVEELEAARERAVTATVDDLTIKVGDDRWNEGVRLVKEFDLRIKRAKARRSADARELVD